MYYKYFYLIIFVLLSSCVSQKKYAELESKNQNNLNLLNAATVKLNTCLDEKATAEAEKDVVLNSLSEMFGELAGADADVDIENEETSVERTIALHNFDMEELKEMLFRVREVAEGKKRGRKNTPICK